MGAPSRPERHSSKGFGKSGKGGKASSSMRGDAPHRQRRELPSRSRSPISSRYASRSRFDGRTRVSDAPVAHPRNGDAVQLLQSLGLSKTAATLAADKKGAHHGRGAFVSPDILARALAEGLDMR